MEWSERTVDRVRATPRQVDEAAHRLRVAMTPTEQALWTALRGKQVAGLKFRRQHPIGPYVADFCCPSLRLIVEVDGEVHDDDEARRRDRLRTERLTAFGYRILRIRNEAITGNLPAVLDTITSTAATLEDRTPPKAPPRPVLGEGAGG